ncbi:hypothetical protein GOBAR_DD20345 [Gossypium barbadense]|nr:hypothetical protein GOBAR_DD20345 [Gossypium barbadense]
MKLKKRSQECSLKSPEEIVDTMVGKKTSGDFGDMEDENEKTYNPNSLKAQLRSIWKTKKKFEILVAGQNLFIISFEDEDDLEHIMERHPWKNLALFKYENLSNFFFGCGRLGHGVKAEDDLPYSLALKAESSIIGKESLLFGSLMKTTMKQCYYTGVEATNRDEGFSPDSTKQIHRTVKEDYAIDVEDKSNKNQYVEVENLKGNSELEGSTNLIGDPQLGHKKEVGTA